jgi:hypothetical protein
MDSALNCLCGAPHNGYAVTIVMTHPPSLSLETGEAQIGGFFIFR